MNKVACGFTMTFALMRTVQVTAQGIPADSSAFRSSTLNASLSASYTTSKNWQSTDFQNYALSSGLFWQDDLQSATRRHQFKVIADLSYLKFIDSVWVKGADRLQANFLWSRTERKWTHSYALVFWTQFLPNEATAFNSENSTMERHNVGGFCSPGGLELSYGATWYPWERSSIQFSFATAKITSAPKATLQDTGKEHFAQSDHTVFDMSYGGSLLVNIDKALTDRINWLNTSRFFCNGLDRDHVNFEVINRVAIKLWKCLQLRFDTRLGYDPVVHYDLKFSQEIMLGVFYERRKP